MWFIFSEWKGCVCYTTGELSARYNRDGFQPTLRWYLQGEEGRPQSAASSDFASHSFRATAISHGLATWIWLQREPYNRLTVIKETSLQSNKISNFQLTRDAFQLAVLFSSFLPPTLSLDSLLVMQPCFMPLLFKHFSVLKHFKSKYYV